MRCGRLGSRGFLVVSVKSSGELKGRGSPPSPPLFPWPPLSLSGVLAHPSLPARSHPCRPSCRSSAAASNRFVNPATTERPSDKNLPVVQSVFLGPAAQWSDQAQWSD